MNMKTRFEKFSRNNTLLSILMLVLGVALFIWPGKSLEVVAKLLGVALLLGAAVSAFSWFRDRHLPNAGYTTLAVGIVLLIAGLVVLIAPRGFVSLLPKLLGAAIVLNGILNLAQSMEMRRMGGSWVGPVIMAALTIVAGLFLIFFAFSAMKAAVMVIGGILIYNGVSNLLIERRYRNAGRQ